MSGARVKLAQKVGDELTSEVDVIVKDAVVTEASGIDPQQSDGAAPALTEAVRALLIMTNCEATFGGNHWVVRKTKISKAEEEAWARASLPNRRNFRFQTGLPLNATFEEWRAALDGLVGGLPNPQTHDIHTI